MMYTGYELLALVIVTCGIALQTWIGIGFGLLSAPLLYLLNPGYVPGPVIILGFLLSLIVVISQRNQLSWRRILPAIIARLPGSWLGALLLVSIPGWALSLLFGSSLLLAVLVTWRSYKVTTTPVTLAVGGFFSGLIGTATSVGGPPIALVYQESRRIVARNEIAAFFLIGTPISILMLVQQGSIDAHSLQLSLKMLPGLIIGWLLAQRFDGYISAGSAKPALLIVSTVSALVVLVKGIAGWLAA